MPSPTKISAVALHLIAPGWFIFYIVFVIFDLLVMNLVIRSIKIVFFLCSMLTNVSLFHHGFFSFCSIDGGCYLQDIGYC